MIMSTSRTFISVTTMSTHRIPYRSRMRISWRVLRTPQSASLRPMLGSHWALQRRISLLTLCPLMKNMTITFKDGMIVTMVTKTITIMTFLTAAEMKQLRITMRTITMTTISMMMATTAQKTMVFRVKTGIMVRPPATSKTSTRMTMKMLRKKRTLMSLINTMMTLAMTTLIKI